MIAVVLEATPEVIVVSGNRKQQCGIDIDIIGIGIGIGISIGIGNGMEYVALHCMQVRWCGVYCE